MMKQLKAQASNINHISSGLRPDEAAAVLREMQRQAEARMLDASQEFQDIAFEMEWRIASWQQLVDERRALFEKAAKAQRLNTRFNVSARKRRGRTPQAGAFVRLARGQQRKLAVLEAKIAECAAAIVTRNEEGSYLEHEIVHLQQRVERISRTLANHRSGHVRLASSEDTAAALARLALELSVEPDVADLDILIGAFEAFEYRRVRKH